ncbi:3D domain-containing protein [Candidatus Uhrbacteria bacterium]|nr:3D domain-containing protein [Candidatus Uhrbacteria bacterium]
MRNTSKPKRSRLSKSVATWVKQLKNKWEEDLYYSRTVTSFCYAAWVHVEQTFKPIRQHANNLSLLSFVGVVAMYVLFPTMANADIELGSFKLDDQTVAMIVQSMQNETESYGRLPEAQDADPRHTFTIPLTAYTSDPAQTDDTPCITASGLDVCERGQENVVAANFLPLGTHVRIPELYGDRVFTVEDRMNERYYYKMDVWMEDLTDAKTFGVKYATVEVF